ncbi:MAG: FHA domain-containing protein [Acidobacteria bacterium]|nr:FHA domain-containing protein [Acidobacteriota bacterium]
MSGENNSTKKKTSLDWLMRGVLTKIGDTVDRLTGRRWTPSSSLATSELIEKLKKLLDLEVQDLGPKGKFVPHNIKLKMQWDKFSTDSDSAIEKLENELKIAAIDHINDNRFHTFAPLRLEVTPDYFTAGVKLLVSFDKFAEDKGEVAINVTVPQIKVGDYIPEALPEVKIEEAFETFIARYTMQGKPKELELTFKEKQRRSVGRTRDNDLSLEDASVSKMHGALVVNAEKQLLVADTGSTNGTFINDKRIAYGRAFPVAPGDRVKFGNVEVAFEYVPREVEEEPAEEAAPTVADFNTEAFTPAASQRDVETVAFNSAAELPPATETVAAVKPPPSAGVAPVKPNEPLPQKTLAETKIAEIRPEAGPKTEPPAATGTQDRIVYDFSNEDS